MKVTGYLSVFCLLIGISMPSFSEPATQSSVKQLMQKVGAGDMSVQMMNQMIPALKQMIPDAPEKFWTDFVSELDAGEMEDLIIPVYQKYLTEEDVVAINSFYDSPAGMKLISVQPKIMQESMIIGQQWGQEIAARVIAKYQAQQTMENNKSGQLKSE
ncbi:MAG: DUF2059 domain-containing protein [Pseudomonadales bacterium]|nr:DUF2059 domain-containing protein [Pseudomonadales bacterium]